MAGRAFSPSTVTIAAGGSVTFRNDDDRAHTVTANDGAFNSGTIGEGGSWKRTFKEAGTFSYLCAIHPEMTGKVVVKGSGGSGDRRLLRLRPPSQSRQPTPTPKPAATRPASKPQIQDFSFAPANICVPIGSTVTWRNTGEAPHTVTAEDGSFDSRDDRGGRVVGTDVRNGRDVRLRLRVPSGDGGRGGGHGRRGRSGAARGTGHAVPVHAVAASLAAGRSRSGRDPTVATVRPEPDAAAVSTQGSTFGGELMARFVIVGLLIGGAFLLFVRAVGGSANCTSGG